MPMPCVRMGHTVTPTIPNLPVERAASVREVDPADVAVPPPGGQVRLDDPSNLAGSAPGAAPVSTPGAAT